MSDVQYLPLGISAAPSDWVIGAGTQVTPKAVYAHYDGSGAAGSYIPTLTLLSDAGAPVASIPMDNFVAAGSSVEATWAPFLKAGTTTQTGTNANLLYSTTLAVDQASVTIPGIIQTFHSLQLTATARSSSAGIFDSFGVRFNGDSGSHYGWNQISYPTDSGVNLGHTVPDTFIYAGEMCAQATDAAAFSVLDMVIGGYAIGTTQKFTVSRWTDTKYPTAVLVTGVNGGEYNVAAAITSITIFPITGPNFKAGSTFVLIGL